MSGIAALFFGKPREAPAPAAPTPPSVNTLDTIRMLQTQINQLEKNRDAYDKKSIEAKKTAIAYHKKGDKRNAVSFLKKAKTFDKHATQFQAMSDNLEAQCTALQVANQTKETIQVMGMATKNLKAATLDADAVADIHDEFVETMEMQEEIASVVSQPFSASGIDDDECLAELDDLMASEATTKLATVPTAAGVDAYGTAALSEFPSVPTNPLVPAPAATELDDDLARLQASLA